MSRFILKITLALAFLNVEAVFTYTAEPALDWDALLSRTEGWLGGDGVYSLDLRKDSLSGESHNELPAITLLWFSDTLYGSTKNEGKEYDKVAMVNHSFALLSGNEPNARKIQFYYNRSQDDKVDNIISGHYWLQDGIRIGSKLWISGILVGKNWKPERIDAITLNLDPNTGIPDFSTIKVDEKAPLWLTTEEDQLDLGSAIFDDADDGYVYVYGYVDRLNKMSRKDMVAARVPRDRFEDYAQWRYFDGQNWSENIKVLLDQRSAIVRGVSTEYSVSVVPYGENQGKFLLVYTPGTIGSRVAFRLAETPYGPFGEECVFYESSVPKEIPGVNCYNAKAHPIVTTTQGVLVSYNVNRLGQLPRKPEEYRPRFLWLTWDSIDKLSKIEK